MSIYRPELPVGMPDRMRRLAVHRGYPVPWFVAWCDETGQATPGRGIPDFRMIPQDARSRAHFLGLCWVCGEPLGRHKAFVIGPMCAVNRTSAEPPSHVDCADWSARACPWLSRPHARRREAGLPDDIPEAPGIMLRRNPGVALVWVTHGYSTFPDYKGGWLIDIGDPAEVRWYAEGRQATRTEVMESIESGLPSLRELADQEGEKASDALDRCVDRALELLPA